jgi:hypothetical protein
MYTSKFYRLTASHKLLYLFQRLYLFIIHIKLHVPIINDSVSPRAHLVLETVATFGLILD